MGPVSARNRTRWIGRGTRGTGQWHREHEGATVTEHHARQAQCVGPKAHAFPPVAPEAPVAEKIPGHQRSRQVASHHAGNGKDDISDKRQSRDGPGNLLKSCVQVGEPLQGRRHGRGGTIIRLKNRLVGDHPGRRDSGVVKSGSRRNARSEARAGTRFPISACGLDVATARRDRRDPVVSAGLVRAAVAARSGRWHVNLLPRRDLPAPGPCSSGLPWLCPPRPRCFPCRFRR